jgi:hypothetical protein
VPSSPFLFGRKNDARKEVTVKALKPVLPCLALAVVAIAAVNFLWFMAETQRLGGDALNGYEENGQYFVAEHSIYRQVSREEWERNRIHAISIFVTHALAMVSMLYLLSQFIFPAFMGKLGGEQAQERVDAVRASGPEIASIKCGGQVGSAHFSKPLLNVSVYPEGILIRPMFMATIAILTSEIQSVEIRKSLLSSRSIQIHNSSRDTNSPLILWVSPDSDVGRAIGNITGMAFDMSSSG